MTDTLSPPKVGTPLPEDPLISAILDSGYVPGVMAQQAAPKEADPTEKGLLGEIGAGTVRGGLSMVGSLGDLANLAGEAMGFESVAKAGKQFSGIFDDIVKQSPWLQRSRSIAGSVIDNPQYWTNVNWYGAIMGEGLFPFLSMLVGGLGAARVAGMRALAKGLAPEAARQVAKRVGAGTAIGLTGIMEGGDTARDIYDVEQRTGQPIPISTKLLATMGAGTINAALEAWFPLSILFRKGVGKGVVHGVIKAIKIEGGTEGAQQVVSNTFAKLGYDPTREMIDGVVESVVGGVMLGGMAGSVTHRESFRDRILKTNPDKVADDLDRAQQELAIINQHKAEMAATKSDELRKIVAEAPNDDLRKTAAMLLLKDRSQGKADYDPIQRAYDENINFMEMKGGLMMRTPSSWPVVPEPLAPELAPGVRSTEELLRPGRVGLTPTVYRRWTPTGEEAPPETYTPQPYAEPETAAAGTRVAQPAEGRLARIRAAEEQRRPVTVGRPVTSATITEAELQALERRGVDIATVIGEEAAKQRQGVKKGLMAAGRTLPETYRIHVAPPVVSPQEGAAKKETREQVRKFRAEERARLERTEETRKKAEAEKEYVARRKDAGELAKRKTEELGLEKKVEPGPAPEVGRRYWRPPALPPEAKKTRAAERKVAKEKIVIVPKATIPAAMPKPIPTPVPKPKAPVAPSEDTGELFPGMPETKRGAALRLADGRILEGRNHAEIAEGLTSDQLNTAESGWMTTKNRFVSEDEMIAIMGERPDTEDLTGVPIPPAAPPVAPEKPKAPKAKELWEMTAEENWKVFVESRPKQPWNNESSLPSRESNLNRLIKKVNQKHKEAVKRAHAEGKPVPDDVLAEYGLKKPTAKVAAAPAKPPEVMTPKAPTFADQINNAIEEKPSGILSEYESQIAKNNGATTTISLGKRTVVENALFDAIQTGSNELGGPVVLANAGNVGEQVFEVLRPYGKLIYNEATGDLAASPEDVVSKMVSEKEVKFGVDKTLLLQTISKDIVNNDLGGTIANETIQNALDSFGSNQKNKTITVDIDQGYGDIRQTIVTISDNGSGMTATEVEKNLLRLGAKGKSGTVTRGGYGLAKAGFLLTPRSATVTTVKNGIKTILSGTREQFFGVKGSGNPTLTTEPTSEDSGTKFELKFFSEEEDAKKENAFELGRWVIGAKFDKYFQDGILDENLTIKYTSSSGDTKHYSPVKANQLEQIFPSKNIVVEGNKATVYFVKDAGAQQTPGWDEKFHPHIMTFNKGLALLGITENAYSLEGLYDKINWKIIVNFTKTPDVRARNYPFIRNRTELNSEIRDKINDIVNEKIGNINRKVFAEKKSDFLQMVSDSPEINGIKILIPFKDRKEFDATVDMIKANEEIVSDMAGIFKSFQFILNRIDAKKINLAITVDPGVHGFRSKPEVVGHEFYAINPFAVTKSLLKNKLFAEITGASFDDKTAMASNLVHCLVHEYTHNIEKDHHERFALALADIYVKISHGQLARLEQQARRFYEKHGKSLESLQSDFERMGKGGSFFSKDSLAVRSTRGYGYGEVSKLAVQGNRQPPTFKFSEGTPTSRLRANTLQRKIDQRTRTWKAKPEIEVVQSQAELPEGVREKAGKGAIIGGVLWKGKAWIVADNVASVDEAIIDAVHEAVGHYGVRGLFGSGDTITPEYRDFLLDLYAEKKAEIKDLGDRLGYDWKGLKTSAERIKGAEEWVAHQAGETVYSKVKGKWYVRLVNMVKAFLRRLGVRLNETEMDRRVRMLIDDAFRAVRKGEESITPEMRTKAPKEGMPVSAYEDKEASKPATAVSRSAERDINRFAQSVRFSLKQAVKNIMDNPNFKKWFGDSKVVDKNGEPLVVYHGTADKITVFNKNDLGRTTNAESARKGYFFTSKKEVAQGYSEFARPKKIDTLKFEYKRLEKLARRIGTNEAWNKHFKAYAKYEKAELAYTGNRQANVVATYLSIKNPLIHDFDKNDFRDETYSDLITQAIKNGNDGVILKNTYDGIGEPETRTNPLIDVYVVFKSTQIKSVFNQGTFSPTNPDIGFALHGVTDPSGGTIKWDTKTLDLSMQNIRDIAANVYSKFIFKEYAVSRYAKRKGAIAEAEAIESLQRRIRARGGITEHYLVDKDLSEVDQALAKDGITEFSSISKPLRDVFEPIKTRQEAMDLQAMMVFERMKAFEKYRPDVDLIGRQGLTSAGVDKMYADIRRRYTPSNLKRLDDTKTDFRKWQVNAFLKPLLKTGWISQKEYDGITSAPESQFYASFFRIMEDMHKNTVGGGNDAMLKAIHGSPRQIIPPIESAIANMARVVKIVEIQRLYREVAKLPDVTKVYKTSPSMSTITVKENGKNQYFRVDPDVKAALDYYTPNEMGAIVKILNIPARVLRAGATLSAEFLTRNPVRDQFSAMLYSKYGYFPLREVPRAIFNILGNTALYQEYKAAGGPGSFFVSLDRQAVNMTARNIVGYPRSAKEIVTAMNPVEALRKLSEFSEKITRVGLYARARAKGATVLEAITESKEGTIDFSRIGQYRALNQITAFWNASIQGTDKLAREFKSNPLGFLTKSVMYITLPSLALWSYNNSDEERRKRYKNLPEWQKNFFWILIPDSKDAPIIRIPKPFELGIIFGSMFERICDYATMKNPKYLKSIATAISESALPGVIPTALLPFIEHITNYSFFRGQPIESEGIKDRPAQYRYTPFTPRPIIAASQMIEKTKVLSISPVKLENWVRDWTGTLGRTFVDITEDLMPARVPKVKKNWYEDWTAGFVRGFIAREPLGSISSEVTEFYDNARKVTEAANGYKFMQRSPSIDRADVRRYLGEHKSDIAMRSSFDRATRQMSVLVKRRNIVMEDKDISSGKKRELIDDIGVRMTDFAERFNNRYNRYNSIKK